MELVSILMPAYNCEQYVKQAIDSILNQTYSNFELLVADDCSKDNTKAIIDSYSDKRIKRFHNENNLGYLKASNKLFLQCKGEFITFQDADDYSDVSRVEKLVGYLNKNKDVSVVGSNVIKVDEKGDLHRQTIFPETHEKITGGFKNYKIVFTGSSLMVRKEVIAEYGIYNEYFDRIGSEDTYWFSKIIQGMKVSNLKEALYYYRINLNSVTSTHKNPKAFVGHDLIMYLHGRRMVGKEDFIGTGNWKAADVCARFLIIINSSSSEKGKALILFFWELIKHPIVGASFIRRFSYNIIKKGKK